MWMSIPHSNTNPKPCKEIVYNGVTYPSVTDASKILGIPTSTLHGRIKRSNDQHS